MLLWQEHDTMNQNMCDFFLCRCKTRKALRPGCPTHRDAEMEIDAKRKRFIDPAQILQVASALLGAFDGTLEISPVV